MSLREKFNYSVNRENLDSITEIVDKCRQAKENWLKEQCEEIESLEKQHKTKEMYDKVKELRNVHLKVEDLSQIKMEKYYLIKKKLLRDGLNI